MKARVHIFYKDSVFDPQGHTLGQSLNQIGFTQVKGVRVGKVVDIDLGEMDAGKAEEAIHQMCEKLLANPVIESFTYELQKSV